MKVDLSPHYPQPAGAALLAAAMSERNPDRMRFVLDAYPSALTAQLALSSSKSNRFADGPPAHIAIAQAWPNALTILFEAGDRFDTPHSKTGQTPLGYALMKGRLPLIEKLLTLGAGVNGTPPQNSPLSALLGRSDREAAEATPMMDALWKAGLDPWQMVSAKERILPLIQAFFLFEQPRLALQLLRYAPVPGVVLGKLDDFLQDWWASWGTGSMALHRELFDCLHEKCGTLPVSFFMEAFAYPGKAYSRGNSKLRDRVATDLLQYCLRRCPDQMPTESEWKRLLKVCTPSFAAKLQAQLLDNAAPVASSRSLASRL